MKKLPQKVIDAWKDRKGPVVFVTTTRQGIPNAIYATCVSLLYDDSTIVIADNYFNKTKANISSGSKASILFITSEDKSYQIKGSILYHKSGNVFDDMKQWNPKKHPGHGAAAVKVEQVYSGEEEIL